MAISKVLDWKNLLAVFLVLLACLLTGCSPAYNKQTPEQQKAKVEAAEGVFIVPSVFEKTFQTASELECDDLANKVKGMVFSNAFGVESKVLKVSNTTKVSQTETKLVCKGEAKMSTTNWEDRTEQIYDDTIIMNYEQDADGDVLISIEME